MLVLLSPSKTQQAGSHFDEFTLPQHLSKTEQLVQSLKKLGSAEIAALMQVSEKLANSTKEKYSRFRFPLDRQECCQALLTFQGDVFAEIDIDNYDRGDFDYAQRFLRILSGLYGILRPLDLIQPYRLEIGGKFRPEENTTLYDFWKSDITESLNQALAKQQTPLLLNLASNEYFKAVDKRKLQAEITNVFFQQRKEGKLCTVAIHAKKARGALANYIIKNRLQNIAEITEFSYNGYSYNSLMSTDNNLYFIQ